jgi:hypothetical protein
MADSSSSDGVGLCILLGVIFIVLKLVGVINWSWWWVLLPLYGGLVLGLIVVAIVVLMALLLEL